MRHLNYNHLLYFWVVGREGTIARAAERLHLTPQTISGQLKLLEDAVGSRLFERRGRHLQLTGTGRTVYGYADEMFRLGTELADVLRGRTPAGQRVFRVGVADVVASGSPLAVEEPTVDIHLRRLEPGRPDQEIDAHTRADIVHQRRHDPRQSLNAWATAAAPFHRKALALNSELLGDRPPSLFLYQVKQSCGGDSEGP